MSKLKCTPHGAAGEQTRPSNACDPSRGWALCWPPLRSRRSSAGRTSGRAGCSSGTFRPPKGSFSGCLVTENPLTHRLGEPLCCPNAAQALGDPGRVGARGPSRAGLAPQGAWWRPGSRHEAPAKLFLGLTSVAAPSKSTSPRRGSPRRASPPRAVAAGPKTCET